MLIVFEEREKRTGIKVRILLLQIYIIPLRSLLETVSPILIYGGTTWTNTMKMAFYLAVAKW